MKVNLPVVGGICQSIQGRDKDRFYIIKEVLAGGFVTVTDGNYKKLASPKKKRLRHVRLTPDVAESIKVKLENGDKVFDTEIYSALKSYNGGADKDI